MSATRNRKGKSRCGPGGKGWPISWQWVRNIGGGIRSGERGERREKEEERKSWGRVGAEAREGEDSDSILNSCQLSAIQIHNATNLLLAQSAAPSGVLRFSQVILQESRGSNV